MLQHWLFTFRSCYKAPKLKQVSLLEEISNIIYFTTFIFYKFILTHDRAYYGSIIDLTL